jgi:transcriptional regulator with XRE-family HTH domain
MHVAYRVAVAVSKDVANAHFAAFVRRQLAAARARGMRDSDIEKATGITNSTFHRWQRGEFGKTGPSAEAVRKFCDGLEIPRKQAADILGWSAEDAPREAPEPELPPEIRELLRRLRDPNVPRREKEFISETLKSLIARTVPRPVRR